MENFATYNVIELRRVSQQLMSERLKLQKQLEKADKAIIALERLLKKNEVTDNEWTFTIPKSFAESFEYILPKAKQTTTSRLKWKEIIRDIINGSSIPVSTQLIYNKLKVSYSGIPDDRRFAIKNISAALNAIKEQGNIFPVSILRNGRKEIVYCKIEHLDDSGKMIRRNFLENYLMEVK